MQYFDTSKNLSPVPWIHELLIPWIRGKHKEWQHGLELRFRAHQQQAAATAIYTRVTANSSGLGIGKIDIYIFLLKCHEQLRTAKCVLHKFHILEWDPVGCVEMSEEPSWTIRLWKWDNNVVAKRRELISQWQSWDLTQLRKSKKTRRMDTHWKGGWSMISSQRYVQFSYPRRQWRTQEFFRGGGSTNSVEDRGERERGSGGGSPLVRGSGGSCNLVQEISFYMVKFS